MLTKDSERAQVGWRFWLWWMLASTVVLAVGGTVGGVVIWFVASFGGEGELRGAVFGGMFGASLGSAQWLVLRRHVSRAGWWVLASTVGGASGFAIAVAIVIKFLPHQGGYISILLNTEFLNATLLGIVIVIGASLGIAQWLVLRPKVSRSGWWVLASAAGPAMIYLVVFYVTLFAQDVIEGFSELPTIINSFEELAVFGGSVGFVLAYGAITGGVLVWLLRQPEETKFRLDKRTRTRLLLAAVFLIVAMAGYFLVAAVQANRATIKANNIIAGLQVPPCSEVYIAPLIRDRKITTCHIKRAHCAFESCFDGPPESRSFILVFDSNAGFRLDNFDGECLLVTGEAFMRWKTPAIFADDQSDVEFCQ